MQALEDTLRRHTPEEQLEEITRQNAALHIQKAWRKRMRRRYLGPDFLWSDLAAHTRMQVDRNGAEHGRNTSRQRWRRGAYLAQRLQAGNDLLSQPNVDEDPHSDAARKHLETQHWLELIDGKHRYGSNLKYYHQRWRLEDTTENFFKWLDYGGGKDLSLRECPREQLENERITYLSPEQRLNYLVTIDNDGKLRWVRNGQLVDTTAGHWKDAGEGKGIIPFNDPRGGKSTITRHSFTSPSSRSSSSTSLSSGEAENAMMHYVGLQTQSKSPVKRAFLRNFTLRGLLEKLLRKTVKRNTWIYVSDKNFNIFIGIKAPGTFQHSSFLAGGLVTSAGLISVKDGMIHTLSPLSGHYRTSIEHFRRFLSVLEERGVDMSKVEVSKAELALWGIEHIATFKKKQAKAMKTTKHETAAMARRALEPTNRPKLNDWKWKREVLEGRKYRQSKGQEGEGAPEKACQARRSEEDQQPGQKPFVAQREDSLPDEDERGEVVKGKSRAHPKDGISSGMPAG